MNIGLGTHNVDLEVDEETMDSIDEGIRNMEGAEDLEKLSMVDGVKCFLNIQEGSI